MPLLEREAQLAALASYAGEARKAQGRLVLVAGEAGVGKSALVEQLQRDTRALDRVLNALNDNPQAFVFGAQRGKPGPGESGFKDGAR